MKKLLVGATLALVLLPPAFLVGSLVKDPPRDYAALFR